MSWWKRRREILKARERAGHKIPTSGTLDEMSYCTACGAGFDSEEPCPGEPPMKWYIYIKSQYGQSYDLKVEKVRICTVYSPEERDELIRLWSQKFGEKARAEEVT
ncbi:MAG: hypothetical protein GF334_10350 [Candidatus Altiarchaeales archaeon]|nr:hypothetical protein [Candidatus Altiarchaeales archaeon]